MASAVARILSRDPEMKALLRRHGPAPIGQRPLFVALARAVAAQQVSAGAATAIFGRVETRIGIDPAALAAVRSDRLRRCGLSAAKARTIRDLARRSLAGELDALHALGDEDVQERLLAIRGIGPWTVQMVMIFALGRADVWPTGDAGIQRAALQLYGAKREALDALGERFRPWRSHAAWYLWRSLEVPPKA
jgi:DNA-3-methyladenine glycosylase II